MGSYSPLMDYVLRQLAQNYQDARPLGAQIPQTTMSDSPRFLQEPDTGDFKTEKPRSSKTLGIDDWLKRQKPVEDELNSIIEQRKRVTPGSREEAALNARSQKVMEQLDQLHDEWVKMGVGAWTDRQLEERHNVQPDADAIMQGIQQRQQQPRDPMQIPGGTPANQTPTDIPMSYIPQQFAQAQPPQQFPPQKQRK